MLVHTSTVFMITSTSSFVVVVKSVTFFRTALEKEHGISVLPDRMVNTIEGTNLYYLSISNSPQIYQR